MKSKFQLYLNFRRCSWSSGATFDAWIFRVPWHSRSAMKHLTRAKSFYRPRFINSLKSWRIVESHSKLMSFGVPSESSRTGNPNRLTMTKRNWKVKGKFSPLTLKIKTWSFDINCCDVNIPFSFVTKMRSSSRWNCCWCLFAVSSLLRFYTNSANCSGASQIKWDVIVKLSAQLWFKTFELWDSFHAYY